MSETAGSVPKDEAVPDTSITSTPASLPDTSIAAAPSPASLPDRPPTARLVLWLAGPVLIQQFLVLAVGLSDRFLAGYFPQVPIQQRAEAAGQQVAAIGLLAQPDGGWNAALAATCLQSAQHIQARQVAYQSAQTTAGYLQWFLSSYIVLVSVGGTALVARFVGGGDWERAIQATNQTILLAAILGIAATVFGLLFMPQLVWLLGLEGDAAEFAMVYLEPLFWLLTFQVIEVAGVACLIGAGDTRTGLWVLGGVAILNLPLAWFFYHGFNLFPGLGFRGIALGTAVSNFLGGTAVLAVLAKGRAGLKLVPELLLPDGELLRRLLYVSVPAGIDSLSIAICQLWFLRIINDMHDNAASAAHGIALQWEGLGYLSGGAFGTAAMALVGQNLGAGRPERAAQSAWLAFWLACAVMIVMGAIFYFLAPWMFYVFCPRPEQWPVIDVGVPVLRLVAFAMPALASCIIFTYALRGAGDTRVPVLFTWIGMLGFRIPLAYLLTGYYGLYGAWLAMFADLVVRGLFLLVRFAGGRWQAMKV